MTNLLLEHDWLIVETYNTHNVNGNNLINFSYGSKWSIQTWERKILGH